MSLTLSAGYGFDEARTHTHTHCIKKERIANCQRTVEIPSDLSEGGKRKGISTNTNADWSEPQTSGRGGKEKIGGKMKQKI